MAWLGFVAGGLAAARASQCENSASAVQHIKMFYGSISNVVHVCKLREFLMLAHNLLVNIRMYAVFT